MRIGNRQFSPKLWAVVLYLAVLSCMLMLGQWQLERAALKVSFQDAVLTARDSAAAVYQRTSIEGRYDSQRQFLWDNRTHASVAGFEVITPVLSKEGYWVLINRGWVEPGATRAQLPEVGLPENVLLEELFIEGLVSQPSKGFASGDAIETSGDWPRILQFFDYELLSNVLGGPVLPVVVQVQSVDANGTDSKVYTQRPEWLQANWQPAASGPAKHYSYAFQWFAMAFALTIIFLVVNTRNLSKVTTDT